jgi:hypothetical protein
MFLASAIIAALRAVVPIVAVRARSDRRSRPLASGHWPLGVAAAIGVIGYFLGAVGSTIKITDIVARAGHGADAGRHGRAGALPRQLCSVRPTVATV